MKKSLSIFLFISTFSFSLAAQPSIQWQKCLGGSNEDRPFSIQQTTEGGYIVVGFSASSDGDVTSVNGWTDLWVVKLNNLGNIEWQKCLGGSGQYDYGFSIEQTTDQGYIVAGSTMANDGDVSGNHGWADIWVVKLNNSGSIEWQKCLGGSSYEWPRSIQQTEDGGYIVAGTTESVDGDVTGNHGNKDYWIVKLDSLGILIWQKCLGGTAYDGGESIQQTFDGGYIVAGGGGGFDTLTCTHGSTDAWITKLSDLGNIEWQKCLGGTGSEVAHAIKQTADSGYIVANETYSNDGDVSGNHGYGDYWIVKLNTVGSIQWQKCLGGSLYDWPESIWQTADGGFVVAGLTNSNDGNVSGFNGGNSDFWIVKLDSLGNTFWQKCLGGTGNDGAESIQQTADDGFIITGFTSSNDNDVSGLHGFGNTYDFWVVKIKDGIGVEEVITTLSYLEISPNPITELTTISFFLSQSENLTINIYDTEGRFVSNIFEGKLSSGSHEIKWDVSAENRIEGGVYFLNFIGNSFLNSSKLVLVK